MKVTNDLTINPEPCTKEDEKQNWQTLAQMLPLAVPTAAGGNLFRFQLTSPFFNRLASAVLLDLNGAPTGVTVSILDVENRYPNAASGDQGYGDFLDQQNEVVVLGGLGGGGGTQGPPGPPGDAATVQVGTTTTGPAGTSASVTNSGTSSAAVLNFTIPQGAQGPEGPRGAQGPPGPPGDEVPDPPPGDDYILVTINGVAVWVLLSQVLGERQALDVRGVTASTIPAATGSKDGPITPGVGTVRLYVMPTNDIPGAMWQPGFLATAENWMFAPVALYKPVLLKPSRKLQSGEQIYIIHAEGCKEVSSG